MIGEYLTYCELHPEDFDQCPPRAPPRMPQSGRRVARPRAYARRLGLGEETIDPVTIYGSCDLTTPERVGAVQTALAVPVTGSFDEATCAAWVAHYGKKPTPEALIAAVLGPDASCGSVVLPVCGGEEPKPKQAGMSTGTMIAIGLVLGTVLAAISASTRRR